MTVPSHYGVVASGGAAAAPTSFVGVSGFGTTFGATSKAVTFPTGTAAGDVALIHLCYQGAGSNTGSISGGAGGWTKDSQISTYYGYYSAVFRKVLASGDLAGVTVNFPGMESATTVIEIAVYRGPTTITKISSADGDISTTLALGSLTKSVNFKALVCMVNERDPGATYVPPGTFTIRGTYVTTSQWSELVADILNPASYVDGTAVTWTNFIAGFPQIGFMYELT